MCDPKYTLIDFETEYELTEDEVKSLEYAEGIVKDGVFYAASARIEGEYYNADWLLGDLLNDIHPPPLPVPSIGRASKL